MKIKPGASLDGIKPAMLRACAIIDEIYINVSGHEVTFTSGTDGDHDGNPETGRPSLHYEGDAGDFRTHDVKQNELIIIENRIRIMLGKDFDVVKRKTHFHIEYDPKGK